LFHLYEHWRTDKNVPFYIGKGNDERVSHIVRDNNRHKTICNFLKKTGHKVVQIIVFSSEIEQEILDAEVADIAAYREAGIKICNKTDGGDGVSGYRHTEEARLKISKNSNERYNGELGPKNRETASAAQIASYNGPNGQKRLNNKSKGHKSHYDGPNGEKTRNSISVSLIDHYSGPSGQKTRNAHSAANRGERNNRCTIPEELAQRVLDFTGTHREAAEYFGISLRHSKSIRKRETWRHLIPSKKEKSYV
jgi:hypothetical protein